MLNKRMGLFLIVAMMITLLPTVAFAADNTAVTAANEFNISSLATNAGAIILVVGIVQILKLSIESLSGNVMIRLLVWGLSFLVLVVANWIIAGILTGVLILQCFANSVLVALGAFGAYNVGLQGKNGDTQ